MSKAIRLTVAALALIFAAAIAVAQQAPALRGFPTAEAAADALTEALRKNDDKAFAAILGRGFHDFVPGNDAHDDKIKAEFLAAWDQHHKLIPDGDDRMLMEVGTTGWRGPIPIVRQGGEWRYDVEAGRKEMIAREIGRNELHVIQTLLAVVDAQQDYAAMDPMKSGAPAYARRLVSSPGRRDGLYWPSKPGEPESPLGPLVAQAQLGDVEANGYYGYRFRLLYRQGAAAPGGAYSYLVNGRMLGGFGVIAWPVRYGETGVMTFIVSQSGDVYEQDLGPDTAAKAAQIASFDPDQHWQKSDMTP